MTFNNPFGVRLIYSYEDHIPDSYQTIPIDSDNVTDGLIDKVDGWNARDPILIDAPTGKGKNTFIHKICIPKALQQNKNILIVSNRVALSTQQKELIMHNSKSPKRELLTEKGLLAEEDFGNIRIITYHKLSRFLSNKENEKWCKDLLFVIMDEAHFFVADSLFNESCTYLLKKATSKFQNAIRIYMTATSWDVLYPLAKAEYDNYTDFSKLFCQPPPRNFLRYYFPRDFNKYHLHFFETIEFLKMQVEKSKQEKWLIFVDRKEIGKNLKNHFGSNAEYIDSEKKDSKALKDIIKNEKFENRILISTAVLDCGINISDPQLKNIAVMTDSKTSFIQMIGRKRLKENETLHLWVLDINTKSATHRYNNCNELLQWFDEFDACNDNLQKSELTSKIWRTQNPKLQKLFYPYKGTLLKNESAEFLLRRKTHFLERIVNGETTFKQEVSNWLNKEPEEEISRYSQLELFCSNHLQQLLSPNDENELRSLVVNAYIEKGFTEAQPTRNTELKERALNTRLEKIELPYIISKVNKQWTIERRKE